MSVTADTNHFAPYSQKGTKVFPHTADGVRFEVGAFKNCPEIKHVSLPKKVYGPPLCTVFDEGVTLSEDTEINISAELCPVAEEADKMPLLVPLPQRTTPELGVTQFVGLAAGNTAADAVAALEFPHSAELCGDKTPESTASAATVTDWIGKWASKAASCVLSQEAMGALFGKFVACERTISLAMVRDGMVHARFPLPPTVHTVSQLLDYVDAAASIATCGGFHAHRKDRIKLNNYYTIF